MPYMKEIVTGQLRFVEDDDVTSWRIRGWFPTEAYENPGGATPEDITAAVMAYLADNPPVAGIQPYEHEQQTAASVWVVEHNLGRFPSSFTLFDSDDRQCFGFTVEHVDENNLHIVMDRPTAGIVRMI